MRVLIIEDDADHAALIAAVLARQFEVESVSRLQAALDHPELPSFDVVLCDLNLPDAAGVDAVMRLRDNVPELPVVVLSSTQDDRTPLAAIDSGAQDFLIKNETLRDPVAAEIILWRTVRYAVQRQASLREERRLMGELRSREQLLEQKNRRLEELCVTAQRFVDNVSHEFRTPLTVIKEYASLIRDGLAGEVNAEQTHMLNVIEDRSDDLNNMVDDMLDVSKLEVGLLAVCRKPCQLAEIVEHVMPALERKAVVRHVSFDAEIPADLPRVWCDEEKVGRTLINLVVNAIKFSGDPGTVRLCATADDEHREVVISVEDNGPGIPGDKLEEIFERFRQPVSGVRQSTKGFGLGLGIAKELVDLNLGRMRVESDGKSGSVFSFSVPYAEPQEVLRRQLARVRLLPGSQHEVCLAVIETRAITDERELTDFELFLQQALHAYDQLFRVGRTRWVAVLAISHVEYELFVARLESEHRELSRNRPRGPLLEPIVMKLGAWSLASHADEEVLQAFAVCAEAEELCHV